MAQNEDTASWVRLVIFMILTAIGWIVVYLFAFRAQYHLWPEQQEIRIVCRAASKDNTYEIPWHYQGIKTPVPIRVHWHVSKPFELCVEIKPDIPKKRPTLVCKIDTRDKNWASQYVNLLLGEISEHLELGYNDTGKRRSFEIIVRAETPTRLEYRAKVNILFVPWSHTAELSMNSLYEAEDTSLTIKIKNEGSEANFIVIYEVYEIKNGKQGPYKEGRIGISKDNRNIIHVGANEELELKPQRFHFKHKGSYFIKTYTIKYQEYLMEKWDFWLRNERNRLTLDEIIKECKLKGIDLWRYSDRHILNKVDVIAR